MLPRKRRNIRYNPRYGREVTDGVPTALKRRPYAYTQLSPEVRKEEERKAKQAREKLLCPNCGAEIKKSQKYCPACGKVLDEE
jgi:rubrerythrin